MARDHYEVFCNDAGVDMIGGGEGSEGPPVGIVIRTELCANEVALN